MDGRKKALAGTIALLATIPALASAFLFVLGAAAAPEDTASTLGKMVEGLRLLSAWPTWLKAALALGMWVAYIVWLIGPTKLGHAIVLSSRKEQRLALQMKVLGSAEIKNVENILMARLQLEDTDFNHVTLCEVPNWTPQQYINTPEYAWFPKSYIEGTIQSLQYRVPNFPNFKALRVGLDAAEMKALRMRHEWEHYDQANGCKFINEDFRQLWHIHRYQLTFINAEIDKAKDSIEMAAKSPMKFKIPEGWLRQGLPSTEEETQQ